MVSQRGMTNQDREFCWWVLKDEEVGEFGVRLEHEETMKGARERWREVEREERTVGRSCYLPPPTSSSSLLPNPKRPRLMPEVFPSLSMRLAVAGAAYYLWLICLMG
ncbi:hypothetical protein Ancab_039016 [Ancistrocladus abbreviatus]